jgi:sucrose phosphorylase
VLDVSADATRSDGGAGLLAPELIDALVEEVHERSRGQSRLATGTAARNLDIYQLNCTYYDALGRDDRDYLLARAIQFFAPGIPQVYYVGLLLGLNDIDLLQRTGVGRDINRRYYTHAEVRQALARPTVQRLLELIRFRNEHPAFGGQFSMPASPAHQLVLEWRAGESFARLEVDLRTRHAAIRCSGAGAMEWGSLARVGRAGGDECAL